MERKKLPNEMPKVYSTVSEIYLFLVGAIGVVSTLFAFTISLLFVFYALFSSFILFMFALILHRIATDTKQAKANTEFLYRMLKQLHEQEDKEENK